MEANLPDWVVFGRFAVRAIASGGGNDGRKGLGCGGWNRSAAATEAERSKYFFGWKMASSITLATQSRIPGSFDSLDPATLRVLIPCSLTNSRIWTAGGNKPLPDRDR